MIARALLIAASLVAGEASACSCTHGSLEERIAGADVIAVVRIERVELNPGFAATLASGQDPFETELEPLSARFRVVDRIKGELHDTQRLVTGFGGGDCGLELTPGHDFLVVETESGEIDADVHVGMCSASRPLGLRSLVANLAEYEPTGEIEALVDSLRRFVTAGEPLNRCLSLRDGPPPDPSRDPSVEYAECQAWFETFEPDRDD